MLTCSLRKNSWPFNFLRTSFDTNSQPSTDWMHDKLLSSLPEESWSSQFVGTSLLDVKRIPGLPGGVAAGESESCNKNRKIYQLFASPLNTFTLTKKCSLTWPLVYTLFRTNFDIFFSIGKRPFYSNCCMLLPGLWMQARLKATLLWYKPLCFSHFNVTQLTLEQPNLHHKRSEVCIKTKTPPASMIFKGQVTEQTTVIWSAEMISKTSLF